MTTPIKVNAGTVPSTHRHPQFGPCIIAHTFKANEKPTNVLIIVADGSSAFVPFKTLKEDR